MTNQDRDRILQLVAYVRQLYHSDYRKTAPISDPLIKAHDLCDAVVMSLSRTTQATLPLVTELVQTCEASPSQWEGRTEDGRYVYIRYRWGELEIGVNADRQTAVMERQVIATIGDDFGGYLSQDDMIVAAADVLRFA